MPETSHFKVFVDGIKVDSLWLKRGESKYVAPIPLIASISAVYHCFSLHCAGSSLDSQIKMVDTRSFFSLFLALLMMPWVAYYNSVYMT